MAGVMGELAVADVATQPGHDPVDLIVEAVLRHEREQADLEGGVVNLRLWRGSSVHGLPSRSHSHPRDQLFRLCSIFVLTPCCWRAGSISRLKKVWVTSGQGRAVDGWWSVSTVDQSTALPAAQTALQRP